MTLNDLKLSECYTSAEKQLQMVNEMERSGDLVGVRLAWKALASMAAHAVARCDDLTFGE